MTGKVEAHCLLFMIEFRRVVPLGNVRNARFKNTRFYAGHAFPSKEIELAFSLFSLSVCCLFQDDIKSLDHRPSGRSHSIKGATFYKALNHFLVIFSPTTWKSWYDSFTWGGRISIPMLRHSDT